MMRFSPPTGSCAEVEFLPGKLCVRSTAAYASCWVARSGILNSEGKKEKMQKFHDLAYVTNGRSRQKLDLFIQDVGKNFPLIIWVHGGAFRMGSKKDHAPLAYLERGFAVASLNYRLSQHAIFPAQIEDIKAAVRWLRANAKKYRLDPNRFGAWGESSGGHLVAMLGLIGDTNTFDVGEY